MRKILILFFCLCIIKLNAQTKENYLLIGTYNSPKSEGIYVYRFNSLTGKIDSVSMTKSMNPSFLAVAASGKFVYAVNEIEKDGNGGNVSAFSFDNKNGNLSFINQQLTGGDNPCHVKIDKTGKWISVSNYSSGNFSILPLNKDGSINSKIQTIQNTGSGINKERQNEPHLHCTNFSPDNKFLYSVDLGIDKLISYSFNETTGNINNTASQIINTKPGAGPRHFTFSPSGKFAYLLEELTGTISAYSYGKGNLNLIQNISTLPANFKGQAGSAEILVSPDGKFLFASNRGESNTIAIFKIDSKGKLSLAGHQSTLGIAPRNFNFDPTGNYLFVANQNSDEIVIFKINHSNGLLKDTGKRISIGKPVCLRWIKIQP